MLRPKRLEPERPVEKSAPKAAAESASTGAGTGVDSLTQYWVDVTQRSVLFLDVLRERANNMLAHEAAGLPPLLHFEWEMVLDARNFAHPANYALLRITACGTDRLEQFVREDARPVVIVDPRAGHGPGIGGFKRDSEVGMALREGHPVYFVIFFPEPHPGQTLADVHHALRRFVEEVARRHPGKPPVLYGNCQAGWAVALLSADCEGLAGPAVLNGSPLSYWAGAPEANPMRLAGGLLGGAWLAHLLADLGDGKFDGAWLAQNFESLNPANTLWDKNDRVFADPEGERERFLEFERWWNGFYFLSREEITAIVENLFIGNRLEQGRFRICEGCVADLTRIRNPLVIFASSGDNITPPQQALNWIGAVYPTTEALVAAGQRIVYLLNPHVGHLGIFVSASVAEREHRAILANVEALERLAPGLYEMKLDKADAVRAPAARFEPRRVEDIRFEYPRESFERVRALSEAGVRAYQAFLGPWVRAFATPWSAQFMKWAHPMRASRYLFSERFNPWMAGVAATADLVRGERWPAAEGNPFLAAERESSRQLSEALERFRVLRDTAQEELFRRSFG